MTLVAFNRRMILGPALVLQLNAGWATTAIAQDAKIDPEKQISQNIQPGQKLTHAIEHMRRQFDMLDVDGNGLSQADADFAEQRAAAEMRANRVSRLLRYDLNGDGSTAREEILMSMKSQNRHQPRCNCADDVANAAAMEKMYRREIDRAMAADKDGSGSVSLSEMLQYTNPKEDHWRRHHMNVSIFMIFDSNKDATVTEVEFEEGFTRVFRSVDTDANGVIDMDEYQNRHN